MSGRPSALKNLTSIGSDVKYQAAVSWLSAVQFEFEHAKFYGRRGPMQRERLERALRARYQAGSIFASIVPGEPYPPLRKGQS